MAHFAKLDKNNKVIAVHVINNNIITTNTVELEQAGIDFLTDLHKHTLWKQTSYNGSFRKNYAGVDYVYDTIRDAFIPPKPYPSWILNEEICQWGAPIPHPNDEKIYIWNESLVSWMESE